MKTWLLHIWNATICASKSLWQPVTTLNKPNQLSFKRESHKSLNDAMEYVAFQVCA